MDALYLQYRNTEIMKINGRTATKEEELKVWEEILTKARKDHDLPLIKYAHEKVAILISEARDERIMNKLNSMA